MKNRRSAVYVKGFGEQIPVILQCSKLKGFARTVSGDSQLYFRPDSNVYAVLTYLRIILGKKKDSESYYIMTRLRCLILLCHNCIHSFTSNVRGMLI
mgnify:CR=1 FL=1